MTPIDQLFDAFDQDDAPAFTRSLMRIGGSDPDQLLFANHKERERTDACIRGWSAVLLSVLARAPNRLDALKKTVVLVSQGISAEQSNNVFAIPPEIFRLVISAQPDLAVDFFSWATTRRAPLDIPDVLSGAVASWEEQDLLARLMDIDPSPSAQKYDALFVVTLAHENFGLIDALSKTPHITQAMALDTIGTLIAMGRDPHSSQFLQDLCTRTGVTTDVLLDAAFEGQGQRHHHSANSSSWFKEMFEGARYLCGSGYHMESQISTHILKHFAPFYRAMSADQRVFSERHDKFMKTLSTKCKSGGLPKSYNVADLVDLALLSREVAPELAAAQHKKPKVM